MNSPRISVVLPTFNRKDKLSECLTSLERQTFPLDTFEVIIVDDGSSDGTAESMQEFLKQTKLHLRYVSQKHAGPGAARNLGVQHANAGVIAFIEDDVVADEHWLEHAWSELQSKDVDCLEGTTLLQGSSESVRVFDEPENFSFIPCNLFIKKDIFLKIGGYDSRFFDADMNLYFREDADLGFRLIQSGCRMHKAHNVIVYHPEQYYSAGDAFRHVRRFYFDPLLYDKNPELFRKLLEVKKIGFVRIKRPFHYLCLFYILFFLLILMILAANNPLITIILLAMALIIQAGIRFRYERSYIPKFWNIIDTIKYLGLPFYYMYWFLRGCRKFRTWGCIF